jgi:hypothetical protein
VSRGEGELLTVPKPRAVSLLSVYLAVKPVGEPDAGDRHVRFDERGWETERRRMAQATAPILDSTKADMPSRLSHVCYWGVNGLWDLNPVKVRAQLAAMPRVESGPSTIYWVIGAGYQPSVFRRRDGSFGYNEMFPRGTTEAQKAAVDAVRAKCSAASTAQLALRNPMGVADSTGGIEAVWKIMDRPRVGSPTVLEPNS